MKSRPNVEFNSNIDKTTKPLSVRADHFLHGNVTDREMSLGSAGNVFSISVELCRSGYTIDEALSLFSEAPYIMRVFSRTFGEYIDCIRNAYRWCASMANDPGA